MRIFTIAKRLRQWRLDPKCLRQPACLWRGWSCASLGLKHLPKISCNMAIVGAGPREYLRRELLSQRECRLSVSADLFGYFGIIHRIYDHRHRSMILGRTAKHGWPA